MEHAYFDALVARPDHWIDYSLREQAQLLAYRQNKTKPQWVFLDTAMDAARVVVPPFNPDVFSTTATSVTPEATAIQLTPPLYGTLNGALSHQIAMKLGAEIVEVNRPVTGPIVDSTVPVLRARHGTTAQVHPAGTPVTLSTNSLLNQLRLPMNTTDGHTYLITWDGLWTPSWLIANHDLTNYKTFQLESDNIWLETRTRFAGDSFGGTPGFDGTKHVAAIDHRGYNHLGGTNAWVPVDQTPNNRGYFGPLVTNTGPIAPFVSHFILHPNTWTRFWIQVQQRANDYAIVNSWVADERTGPVQILRDTLATVRPQGIQSFWAEFNTSINTLKAGRGDLIAYLCNVVVLRDPTNVASLLIRPLAGAPVPPDPQPPDIPRPDDMKNPRKCIFRHDDRANTTGYRVDSVDASGNVARSETTDLGTVDDQGDVNVSVNVMPVPVGTYRFIVYAMSGVYLSDPSLLSDTWERVPGPPGQPRAA